MINIKLYNLNIKLKYKFLNNELEEDEEDIEIIRDGVYDMYKIRNINFYDELVNKLPKDPNHSSSQTSNSRHE